MAANEQRNQQPRPSQNVRMVTLKSGWDGYDYGPYERFPQPRQAVMEGYLMQRFDPTVGAAMALIEQLITSRLGDYTHPDERAQELVRGNLRQLRGGRQRAILSLLSCLWAGFAVAAKRWVTNESEWRIEALDLLHPLTLFSLRATGGDDREQKNEGIVTEDGAPTLFRQFPARTDEQPAEFTRDQVVYWPFMQRLREEVYGRRLTDRARRSWFMRVKLEKFWAIYLEKAAHPIPIFRVPKGMQVGPTGADITNSEFYGNFIGSLTAGQGLAIEAEPDDQFNFDLLESRSGGDEAYQRAAAYHNAELFKSLLTSPLMFEEASQGTRAQGTVALEITLMLVEAIREELGSVLVEDIARPLIEYNLGARDDYGTWKFEPLRDEDLESTARVLEIVSRAGIVNANPADERKTRETYASAGYATADEITAEDLAEMEDREDREAEQRAALIEARSQQLQAGQPPQPGGPEAQHADATG